MNDLLDVKMVLKEAVFTSKHGYFCLAGKDETGWKISVPVLSHVYTFI